MPLFGSARDASFIRSANREIMHKIVGLEVEYYKINLTETKTNIYNESLNKTYYNPVRVSCLLAKDPTTTIDNEFGKDIEKTVRVGFLRDDLVDLNLVVEIGDIFNWDGKYFEIDEIQSSNYWLTRNPEQLIAYKQNEVPEFGYSVSIVVSAHRTNSVIIQIENNRSGINDTLNDNKTIPRGL